MLSPSPYYSLVLLQETPWSGLPFMFAHWLILLELPKNGNSFCRRGISIPEFSRTEKTGHHIQAFPGNLTAYLPADYTTSSYEGKATGVFSPFCCLRKDSLLAR
jgi:hypothetical protein